MDSQGNIDLLIAYANKIALGLSMKEHAVNERMIDLEGRTIYSLNVSHPGESFRKYTGPKNEYNSREESSLCGHALAMVEAAMSLDDLLVKRNKNLISCAFDRTLTRVKEEESEAEEVVKLPFESFRGLDYQLNWNKQIIRKFIVENYRKNPQEIRDLMRSLGLPRKLVKQWILYSQKRERIVKLREEVVKQSLKTSITLADFKRMARKIYRTRLFRATDNWCLNYIRKYQLEDVIEVPEGLIRK